MANDEFYDTIGGAEDGGHTTDAVSNDLDKLKGHAADLQSKWKVSVEHPLMGGHIADEDGKGTIVAVVVDADEDDYAVGVIYQDPILPDII